MRLRCAHTEVALDFAPNVVLKINLQIIYSFLLRFQIKYQKFHQLEFDYQMIFGSNFLISAKNNVLPSCYTLYWVYKNILSSNHNTFPHKTFQKHQEQEIETNREIYSNLM